MTARGGRRAVVPHYANIPDRLSSDGLAVTVRSEDGRESITVSFRDWDAPLTLLADLARALVSLTGQQGTWKSVETSRNASSRWRPLVRYCNAASVTSIDDLTPEHWYEFVDSTKRQSKKTTAAHSIIVGCRSLLLAHPTVNPATARAARERFFLADDNREQPHYSLEEFKMLRTASRRALRRASDRIAANWTLARVPRDEVPTGDLPRWVGLNRVLDGAFPESIDEWIAIGAYTGTYAAHGRSTGSKKAALQALFLDPPEVLAAMTALACETGENLSTLARREVPSTASTSGDESLTILMSDLDKPRRGPTKRHMREHASSVDAHGKLLATIVAVTEPSREAARRQGLPFETRLFWCTDRKHLRVHGQMMRPSVLARRNNAEWLQGAPPLNFKILRRTYVNRIASREVHHSTRTNIESYLSSDPAQRLEWAATATAGLEALFAEAEATFVRLLTQSEAAEEGFLRDPSADLTPSGLRCRDSDHHPRTGLPCDDDFLACLGCANAFATEEHLPLLVALYDLLEQARQSVSAGVWERRYQIAWARLTVMLRRLSAEQWLEARERRCDRDFALAFAVVESREFEI